MSAPMNTAERQRVCDYFHLGAPVLSHPAGGTCNRNWILQTDSGGWFARERFPGYCQEDRILFDHRAAAFWASRGLPVAPPKRAREGQTYLRDCDRVWEVYPLLSGRQLRDGDKTDILPLAETLAALHETGRGFDLRYEKAAARGETGPDRLLDRIAALQQASPEIEAALSPYRDAVTWASGALPDRNYKELPYTLIHGDLQPANILMKNRRVAGFVDLDWCMWLPRVYDLGFAILCCCAAHGSQYDGADIWSVTQTPHLEPSLTESFLERYQSAGDLLSRPEWAALLPQLVLAWCEMRIDGAFKVALDRRLEFLERDPKQIVEFAGDALPS